VNAFYIKYKHCYRYIYKFESLMNKYEELDSIGKGQFGVVKKIRRLSDGLTMVWKEVNYGPIAFLIC